MASSGAISQTVFTTQKVIDNAARRCRLTAQQITAEHISIANDNLYLLLSDLANQGAPLWCIERVLLPLYQGIYSVPLDTGTVDIRNANLRYLQEVTGTNTDIATARTIEFDSATPVTTVGIKWDAASAPLSFERSDDGAAWTVIQSETPDAAAGEWSWYDMAQVIDALYFRIRATSGVLDYEMIYTGNNPTEIPLARLNIDEYTTLPNKSFTSNRPLQYWFDRLIPRPLMQLWPTPNEAAEVQQIVVWRHRYIQDVGTMVQTLDIPQRWFEAVVAGLAAKLVWELPEADVTRAPALKSAAAEALYVAQMEERDKSPINFAPNISAYTS